MFSTSGDNTSDETLYSECITLKILLISYLFSKLPAMFKEILHLFVKSFCTKIHVFIVGVSSIMYV